VKVKEKYLLVALVMVGTICGVVGYIGYTLLISSRPARQVLTEEEVRRLITEHPSEPHFEVRPETIEFLSLELVPIEESPLAEEIGEMENLPDKVWVVEYECDGRVWLGTIGPPPPFTRMFVRVVIDAYTGQKISSHAENIEPEQLITFEEACNVFSQYFGGGRWEGFIELIGEDVEYSFKVYRKDDLAGYFLYRASNGTLFEADYQSGEVGKALRQIIVPEDKEDYYVWEIIDLSPEYGGYKDKYIDARNEEILLGLPRGKRGPSPTPTHPPMLAVEGIQEAEAVVGYKIPVPTQVPGDLSLQRILIQSDSIVYLLYADGPVEELDEARLMFIISQLPSDVDLNTIDRWINDFLNSTRMSARRITINGYPGYVTEPGIDPLTGWYEKGSLQFWAEGLDIQIYGDYSSGELIKIAESLPLPSFEPPPKPFPSFVVHYLNVTLEEGWSTVHIHRGSSTTITIAVDRIREDVADFAPLIYVSSEMFTVGMDEAKLVDRINNYVDGMTINLNPLNIIFSGVEKRAYAKLTINVGQGVNPGTYWFEILVPLKEGKGFGLHSLRIVVEG